jgi:hypothetical protein
MGNRLPNVLTGLFPARERAFDYSAHKGAIVLLADQHVHQPGKPMSAIPEATGPSTRKSK